MHLKRFRSSRSYGYFTSGSSKLSVYVDFPVTQFDINNFVLDKVTILFYNKRVNHMYMIYLLSQIIMEDLEEDIIQRMLNHQMITDGTILMMHL